MIMMVVTKDNSMNFWKVDDWYRKRVKSFVSVESIWNFDIEYWISYEIHWSILYEDSGMPYPYCSQYSLFIDESFWRDHFGWENIFHLVHVGLALEIIVYKLSSVQYSQLHSLE